MAAGGLGVEVILVGQRAAIEAEMEGAKSANIRIVDAADVIGMEEHPTEAVKAKPTPRSTSGCEW
jgi:fatty acid/phospholipid biosynthesis enzyme